MITTLYFIPRFYGAVSAFIVALRQKSRRRVEAFSHGKIYIGLPKTSVPPVQKFTIQVFFSARDDEGKPIRAVSVFQTEASDIGQAYQVAERSGFIAVNGYKLGAIVPGHHERFP